MHPLKDQMSTLDIWYHAPRQCPENNPAPKSAFSMSEAAVREAVLHWKWESWHEHLQLQEMGGWGDDIER